MEEARILQINEDLRNKFNFNELNFSIDSFIDFIANHQDESPFELVYRSKDGKLEMDKKIREDLTTLVGYVLQSPTKETVIVLLKTITEKTLKENGCEKKPTIGDLRQIASQLHPDAKPINSLIAGWMWMKAKEYYILKYLLGLKNYDIPDISFLSSVEEDFDDQLSFIDGNFSGGFWDYWDGDYRKIDIKYGFPIFCAILNKQQTLKHTKV